MIQPSIVTGAKLDMEVTLEKLLGKIIEIENAIRHGLQMGNIKAIMKEKKAALVSDWHAIKTTAPLKNYRNNYLVGKRKILQWR